MEKPVIPKVDIPTPNITHASVTKKKMPFIKILGKYPNSKIYLESYELYILQKIVWWAEKANKKKCCVYDFLTMFDRKTFKLFSDDLYHKRVFETPGVIEDKQQKESADRWRFYGKILSFLNILAEASYVVSDKPLLAQHKVIEPAIYRLEKNIGKPTDIFSLHNNQIPIDIYFVLYFHQSGISKINAWINDYLSFFKADKLSQLYRLFNPEYSKSQKTVLPYHISTQIIEKYIAVKGSKNSLGVYQCRIADQKFVQKISCDTNNSFAVTDTAILGSIETIFSMLREGSLIIKLISPNEMKIEFVPEKKLQEQEKASSKSITFDVPEGTKWENITIDMVSDDCINITVADGRPNRKHAAELGFIDNRRGETKKKAIWQTLKLLCLKGAVSWEDTTNFSKKERNAIKKNISRLRKHLESVFPNCQGTPISNYNKRDGYKACFGTKCSATFQEDITYSDNRDELAHLIDEQSKEMLNDEKIQRQQLTQEWHNVDE